jgi:hypothetical protein
MHIARFFSPLASRPVRGGMAAGPVRDWAMAASEKFLHYFLTN